MHNNNFYEPIESASQDELEALQLKRLQWTLAHAYRNVPMYQKKFDDIGIKAEDLTCLADIKLFPFTTKEDLRLNYPFNTFAVPMDKVVRIHASSGTTGKPTVVGYTKNDIATWATVVARSIFAAGGRAGDRVHIAYGYGLFTGGLGAHYGAEKLGTTVIPMSGGNTARQVQLIEDFTPNIIMVTPSYMLNILEEYKKQSIPADKSSLKIGIFGAEPWTNAMRHNIEQEFNMDATDIYGLSEVIGPGVAQECIESKDGPIIWEDHFYPEIINPETLAIADNDIEGELVFTSLTKEAMPIIRYRTRDLTRLLPPTARSMRRMDKIVGRSDDMIIIRGVNIFPSQIEEKILTIAELSPHYQIELNKVGNLDSLTVKIEQSQNANNADSADINQATKQLATDIKTHIGISVLVELCKPNSIPRSEGKAVRVIDLRNK